MVEEFRQLQGLLKTMKGVYLNGLYSFYFFEAISELVAPNVSGQEAAKENAKVMRRYNGFWEATRRAHYFHCIVQFAKCFDQKPTNISLALIQDHSWMNPQSLTVDAFSEFNKDRQLLDVLIQNYQGISEDNFKEMKELRKKCHKSIDNLVQHRHQLCHAMLEPKELEFTVGELHDLSVMIGKILNIFTSQTNHETTWYDRVEEDAKNAVTLIIDELKRFEPYRLREIEEKYESLREDMS